MGYLATTHNIVITSEVDGLEMGVLADGTSFLSGRALARLCGVATSTIIYQAAQWRAGNRATKLGRLLETAGIDSDSLFIEAESAVYVRKDDAHTMEAQRVATRIASAIGGRVGDNHSRRGDGVHVDGEPDAIRRLLVRPAYCENEVSVDFQVHGLDPETAAEVLATIRRAEDRKIATRARVEHEADELDEEEAETTTAQRLRIV